MVVCLSDGLIALNNLEVSVTIKRDISVEALSEAIDGCNKLVAVLVHETEIQNNRCSVWMIIATDHLQDVLSSV